MGKMVTEIQNEFFWYEDVRILQLHGIIAKADPVSLKRSIPQCQKSYTLNMRQRQLKFRNQIFPMINAVSSQKEFLHGKPVNMFEWFQRHGVIAFNGLCFFHFGYRAKM